MLQIIEDRRALHQIPELDRQLPETLAYLTAALAPLRCRLLRPMAGALCAYFDFGAAHTIAFRSDADALPVQEQTGLPFASHHPGKMHACGHDAHMAMLLELARAVAEGEVKPERKTSLFFSVYEEVGHGASAGIPDDTEDLLVVDMGCVGEGLSCTEQQVSICAKDSSGPYDYSMTGELIDLCQKHQLDYAVDVYPFYGSDAGAALRSGRDIRYALIGAGVYASHGYERSHVKGVENTLRLIEKYVEKA